MRPRFFSAFRPLAAQWYRQIECGMGFPDCAKGPQAIPRHLGVASRFRFFMKKILEAPASADARASHSFP